jgi:hypothetical protein
MSKKSFINDFSRLDHVALWRGFDIRRDFRKNVLLRETKSSLAGLILAHRTGTFNQGFNESPAPASLDHIFPLHSAGSIRVFLRIDQFPGPFLFCVLGPDLIVMLYSGIDIFRRSHIITAVLETSEDVDENRHTQTIKGIAPPGQPF